MTPIRCFLLEPVPKMEVSLRRFRFSHVTIDGKSVVDPEAKCPGYMGSHDASVVLGIEAKTSVHKEYEWGPFDYDSSETQEVAHDDPRWPVKCDSCDYVFRDEDYWQVNHHHIYRRSDTSEEVPLNKAPIGAMWYAPWMVQFGHTGPDGKVLVVKIPGTLRPDGTHSGWDWTVDGVASNCTMPEDDEHRCWVREGVPPNVTISKNGKTCAAGAGSIQTPGWHGFLRAGSLVE